MTEPAFGMIKLQTPTRKITKSSHRRGNPKVFA